MAFPASSLDMYNLTLELINKSNNTSITPDEWNIWANTLQIEYVLSLYRQYQKDQSVMDRLNPIIIDPNPIVNSGANISGQEEFVMPLDYWRLLHISFRLQYVNDPCIANGPGNKFVSAGLVSDDEYTIIEDNPFRKPTADNLLYYQAVNSIGSKVAKLKPFGQSYGLEAKIRYLREPRQIDVTQSPGIGDCELPTDAKNDLCHIIARRIIEAIESGRYPQIAGETNQVINN